MKDVGALIGAVVFFCIGFWMGTDLGQKAGDRRCESVVVSSILNGKPFMFYDRRPVMIDETVRKDRSVVYRAMSEAGKAVDSR